MRHQEYTRHAKIQGTALNTGQETIWPTSISQYSRLINAIKVTVTRYPETVSMAYYGTAFQDTPLKGEGNSDVNAARSLLTELEKEYIRLSYPGVQLSNIEAAQRGELSNIIVSSKTS